MGRLKAWTSAPFAGPVVTVIALLALWRDNINRLPIESAWPTLAGAAGVAMLVVALLRPIAGSWARAGLMSGLVAVYIFYVPALLRLVSLPRAAIMLAHVVAILTFVLIARKIPKDRDRARNLAAKINLLCVLLLALNAVPMAWIQWQLEGPRRAAQNGIAAFEGHASADSPDVWHFIFDRYAGSDTLRSVYAFDNSPFVTELRKRGFAVNETALSNYQRTGHSVAATVNGTMLDSMTGPMQAQPSDWVPIYRSIRNSAATRFFASQGYHTVFAGSWWEPTRFSNIADESIEIRAMPQLARLAINRSAIGTWIAGLQIPYLDGRADQCFRANEKFRRLGQLARDKERKYVFAHFLVPHPPFVLNADGSCKSLAEAKATSRRDNYVAQLQFANREALKLIDAILAGPRPAIIILHSDEGPWPEPHVGNEHGLGTDNIFVDWKKLPPAKLREKMSILLAIRSPAGVPATMAESPVQIYPAVLHDHFASKTAIPPSRYLLFENDRQLYRVRNVSDQLATR